MIKNLDQYRQDLERSAQINPTTAREGVYWPVWIYTDPDNDEIRFYDFVCEKVLPDSILSNPTCLEPIDLRELVEEFHV